MTKTNAKEFQSDILNYIFNKKEFITPPISIYVGYCIDEIINGSATEYSGSGYSRQLIEWSSNSIDGSPLTLGNEIFFPETQQPHTITGVALFDSAEGGRQITDWKRDEVFPRVGLKTGDIFRLPMTSGFTLEYFSS